VKFEVGCKVYVKEHKRPFYIKACDDRYAICTKPYNFKHTVIYFIVDVKVMERGPDNMVFCSGYETIEQCQERLKELQSGEITISQRYKLALNTITQIGKNFYLYWKK